LRNWQVDEKARRRYFSEWFKSFKNVAKAKKTKQNKNKNKKLKLLKNEVYFEVPFTRTILAVQLSMRFSLAVD
jgi:hypothetical protein